MEEEKVVVEEVQAEETAEQPVMVEVAPEEGAQIITIKKLLEAGSQFGHQTKRWNPKMAPTSMHQEMEFTLLIYKKQWIVSLMHTML